MKISYELNGEDQWYFLKYLLKHHPIMRRNYLTNFFFTLITPPILLGVIYYANIVKRIWEVIFILLFSEVTMILWYIKYPKRQMKKLIKHDKSLIGSHTMGISSEGVRESKLKKEIFVPWVDVKKISQDTNSIYIFTSETGGFIIPKRSFSSKEEETKVLNELVAYTNK